jgi:hypothetical protein
MSIQIPYLPIHSIPQRLCFDRKVWIALLSADLIS